MSFLFSFNLYIFFGVTGPEFIITHGKKHPRLPLFLTYFFQTFGAASVIHTIEMNMVYYRRGGWEPSGPSTTPRVRLANLRVSFVIKKKYLVRTRRSHTHTKGEKTYTRKVHTQKNQRDIIIMTVIISLSSSRRNMSNLRYDPPSFLNRVSCET